MQADGDAKIEMSPVETITASHLLRVSAPVCGRAIQVAHTWAPPPTQVCNKIRSTKGGLSCSYTDSMHTILVYGICIVMSYDICIVRL